MNNYSHYGNPGIPFTLVKSFASKDALVEAFKQGSMYTEVKFGEYAIVTNGTNIEENGKIYRRGYNYTNDDGGAIYIGNISEGVKDALDWVDTAKAELENLETDLENKIETDIKKATDDLKTDISDKIKVATNELTESIDEFKTATEADIKELEQSVIEAIQSAEQATTSANQAADNANQKATTANDAANNAIEAKNTVLTTNQIVNDQELIRQQNETTRQSEEIARRENEINRINNETTRQSAENIRVTQENARQTAENERKNTENSRQETEDIRNAAETIRAQNEVERINTENLRIQAETNRSNAEQNRIETEQARVNAEDERIETELIRKNNEAIRQENETIRVATEEARQESEAARKEAELARQAEEDDRADRFEVWQQRIDTVKDGGYYIPDVNEEGDLTWYPSDADMPLIEGDNIRGPQGVSGVYVGRGEMPEGYNVQVIPDGDESTWVQADWAQSNPAQDDYIKNKPNLGALANKNKVEYNDLSDEIVADIYVDTIVDDTIAYSKTVRGNKVTSVNVSEVGGMSYKTENLIPFPYIIETQTVDGVTYTINMDGSISVSGTPTTNTGITLTTLFDIEKIKYFISLQGSFSNMFIVWDLFIDGNKVAESFHTSYALDYTNLEGKIQLRVGLRPKEVGVIVSGICKPMLNKGEVALSYQPYFTGLRDSKVTEIESIGVNLITQTTDSQSMNGITFTKNADGSITANGTATRQAYNTMAWGDKPLSDLPNGTYMLTLSGGTETPFIYISFSDGTRQMIRTNSSKSFEITDDKKIDYIIFNVDVGKTVTNETYYIMLNKGKAALPYSPYFRNTIEIPEEVQALDGYGQGINEKYYNKIKFDFATNKKKFIRQTKRIVFNGDSEFQFNQSGQFLFVLPQKANKAQECKCTHYKSSPDGAYMKAEDQVISVFSTNVWIYDTRYPTLSEFKTYLEEQSLLGNPITLEYVLLVPIETDISEMFPASSLISAETGGTITAINEYKYKVPFTLEYIPNNIYYSKYNPPPQSNWAQEDIAKPDYIQNKPVIGSLASKNLVEYSDLAASVSEKIENNTRQIEYLTSAFENVISVKIDDDIAYQKDVPNKVLAQASINEIGGMSYKCENLILFPFADGSKTTNGITFTDNNDGSLTINGTAAVELSYVLMDKTITKGTYTISVVNPILTDGVVLYLYAQEQTNIDLLRKDDIKRTFTINNNYTELSLYIPANTTFNNFTLLPMLNYGETALPYQSYFTGLRDSKVTAVESVGVNKFNVADKIIGGQNSCIVAIKNDTVEVNINGGDPYFYFGGDMPYGDYYYYSFTNNGGRCDMWVAHTDGTSASILRGKGEKFTYSPNDATHFEIEEYANQTYEVQIMWTKEPLEKVEFIPYFRNTFPIPEAVQNLDGYGQGINKDYYNKIMLNPVEGVKKYVKNVSCVDLGTLEWHEYNESVFWAELSDGVYTGSTSSGAVLCSNYHQIGNAVNYDKTMAFGTNFLGSGRCPIVIHDNDYADSSAFKAAMSGVMLIYELASSIETDISEYFTDDNLLPIEANGIITAVNEYEQAVPSEIQYLIKGAIV